MSERDQAASIAPHVIRQHRAADPYLRVGTITHGGPNQYLCGLRRRGDHADCPGCNGLEWYALGGPPCWCYKCRAQGASDV